MNLRMMMNLKLTKSCFHEHLEDQYPRYGYVWPTNLYESV
jgi:hypothetical protein